MGLMAQPAEARADSMIRLLALILILLLLRRRRPEPAEEPPFTLLEDPYLEVVWRKVAA